MLAYYVSVSIATNDVSKYNNQWFYSVFCLHIVNMDLLYYWRDGTPLNVFCIMLLLVVLVEPHYEINLLCKVYNVSEIDCERASTHNVYGDHYVYGCSQQGQGNIFLYHHYASCFIEYILKLRYEFDFFDLHEPNDNKALNPVRRLNTSTFRHVKPITWRALSVIKRARLFQVMASVGAVSKNSQKFEDRNHARAKSTQERQWRTNARQSRLQSRARLRHKADRRGIWGVMLRSWKERTSRACFPFSRYMIRKFPNFWTNRYVLSRNWKPSRRN